MTVSLKQRVYLQKGKCVATYVHVLLNHNIIFSQKINEFTDLFFHRFITESSHCTPRDDPQQYRIIVGSFYIKIVVCCPPGAKCSFEWHIHISWLEGIMICVSMILLLCGDVEVNPGAKGMKHCPECESFVSSRLKVCVCI